MTRLAPVLFDFDLPLAELCASRLDGELFAIDDGFCPIDQLENPEQRARAVAPHCPDRLIAEQRTAAWIWGAIDTAPLRLELCASIGARARPVIAKRATVREVVIESDELALVGGVLVTSPLRTAIDLARFATKFGAEERDAVGRLMQVGTFGLAECRRALDRRNNLPNKVRAWKRITLAVRPT